jgi:L-asparaginase
MSETKKHIYVAYTGGTIGMAPSDKGYQPVTGFLQSTVAKMPEFYRPEMPNFTIHEYPTLLDSSDMHPSDWQMIADDIVAHYEQYDGFIILHGTDTMAYTASAVSFMLQHLTKPVIVTGSQIPIAELRSDGQINLLNALYIAANYPVPEVTLFFNHQLLRGNRARKVDADGFAAFASPNYPALIDAGIAIDIHPHTQLTKTENITANQLQTYPIKAQPVAMVILYPGISLDIITNLLQQPVRAMIIMSYGVGNAPNQTALLQVFEDATRRGIIIINCTQCLHGKVNMQGYANGQALQDVGVISGYDMTPEAALTKLHFVLSQTNDTEQAKQWMLQDLCGEMTLLQ